MLYHAFKVYRLRRQSQSRVERFRKRPNGRHPAALLAIPALAFSSAVLYAALSPKTEGLGDRDHFLKSSTIPLAQGHAPYYPPSLRPDVSLTLPEPAAPRIAEQQAAVETAPETAAPATAGYDAIMGNDADTTHGEAIESAATDVDGDAPAVADQLMSMDLSRLFTADESLLDESRLGVEGFTNRNGLAITLGLPEAVPGVEEITEEDEASNDATLSRRGEWVEEEVKSGDNLSAIFERLGVSHAQLDQIMASGKEARSLAMISPGKVIKFKFDADGRIEEIIYKKDEVETIKVVAQGDDFRVNVLAKPIEKRRIEITGTISSSLFDNARAAGLSAAQVLELANIFKWDIDFALDVKPGDTFSVIYDGEFIEEKRIGAGPILAAEFVNKGKRYRGIRWVDDGGKVSYIGPTGEGMKKPFLRAPVDFRAITSKFAKERFHPVLGVKRPHKGVDYSAVTGTPVYASGDGRINFIGSQSGYGNVIILEHSGNITTLYGHLSKFRSNLAKGAQVQQGQIIGYVGQTGIATGPHLHYEFRVAGNHVDPLTTKLAQTSTPDVKAMAKFKKDSAELVAKLDTLSGSTAVARFVSEAPANTRKR